MRIGLVTDFYHPWIGGPSILLRNLARGLAERGHMVSLLAPSADGRASAEKDEGLGVERVRTIPSPFGHGLRVAPPLLAGAGRWMDETLPDVVHVHHPFPLSASAIFAARKRGIPVAATNHTIPVCSLWGIRGSGPFYTSASAAFGRWIVFLMRRCEVVATPTRTAADNLSEMGFHGDVVVISNGVDTSRFSEGPEDPRLRARLGLDSRPVVLYTGRLDAEKQMDVWLEAARSLRDLEVQFVVGGDGGDRLRLERMAQEPGLAGRVRFIGFLDDEVFPALYRLAAAYFITSPVELQSIATLEAMASGLPVVACRSGALPELVHQAHNGWLFQPGDWSAAANGLRRILTDRAKAADMGHRSIELAARHRLEESIAAYEQFLERAVHARRGEPQLERAAAARS